MSTPPDHGTESPTESTLFRPKKRVRTHEGSTASGSANAPQSQSPQPLAAALADETGSEAAEAAAVGVSEAMEQNYAGFRVPASIPGPGAAPQPWQVPKVDFAEVSADPEWFWREYVSRRKPCIIRGLLQARHTESKGEEPGASGAGGGAGAGADAGGSAPSSPHSRRFAYTPCFHGWTNEFIRSRAGDAEVSVESRSGATDRFGKGVKETMTVSKFLDLLESGDEDHYLPAQELPLDEDGGGVGLFAPPMDRFANDLPWRPHILPHLVPQQMNIWMGNAKDGSSSGLHHDYHDNLYLLLRGRKRFTLFSPADAAAMNVHGRIRVVHPNGLITYHGSPSLRADGVADDAAAEERRVLAEEQLERAKERLAKAEADATELMRVGSNGSAKAEYKDKLAAMKSRLDAANAAVASAEEEIESALEASLTAQLEMAIGGAGDDMDYSDADSAGGSTGGGFGGSLGAGSEEGDESDAAGRGVASADPQSFSRIEAAELHGDGLGSKWPEAAAAHRGHADVVAGEMLYLPTGWFHEVTSFTERGGNGHLAVNYWFHPPDNMNPSTAGFLTPYVDAYWHRDWHTRFAGKGGIHELDGRPHSDQPEVFLGGACDPTTWRFDVAMPILEAAGVSFYNPQVKEWHSGLIALENNAKAGADVLIMVLSRKTRGLATLVEVRAGMVGLDSSPVP